MRFTFYLFVLLVLPAHELPAQVPFYTIIDTAECNKRKAQKLKCRYSLEQKYDTVSGKIFAKDKVDTVLYTRFDEQGRETEFCYYDEGVSNHVWLFYDSLGRVYRRLSADADSANGFSDTWYYNDSNQVVREESFTLTDRQAEQFSATQFQYNRQGQLISQAQYYTDPGEEERLDRRDFFYYDSLGREILTVTLNEKNDTMYIDSTFYTGHLSHSERMYAMTYYARVREGEFQPKILRGDYYVTGDTVDKTIVHTYQFRLYNYETGSVKYASADTIVSRFNGNLIVVYGKDGVTRYWYNEKGQFQYNILYDRRNHPIKKRTEYCTYYR
jgi:hypothetical protein